MKRFLVVLFLVVFIPVMASAEILDFANLKCGTYMIKGRIQKVNGKINLIMYIRIIFMRIFKRIY